MLTNKIIGFSIAFPIFDLIFSGMKEENKNRNTRSLHLERFRQMASSHKQIELNDDATYSLLCILNFILFYSILLKSSTEKLIINKL